MAKAPERTAPMFVPRTIASLERAVSRFVTRFARPVQVLGQRTLGFSDRILHRRIGSMRWLAPLVARRPGAALASLLMVEPWYHDEVGAQPRIVRRPRREAASLEVAQTRAAVPEEILAVETASQSVPLETEAQAPLATQPTLGERGAAIPRTVLELDGPEGESAAVSEREARAAEEPSSASPTIVPEAAPPAVPSMEAKPTARAPEVSPVPAPSPDEVRAIVAEAVKRATSRQARQEAKVAVQQAEAARVPAASARVLPEAELPSTTFVPTSVEERGASRIARTRTAPVETTLAGETRAMDLVEEIGGRLPAQPAGLPASLATSMPLASFVINESARGLTHVDWADDRLARLARYDVRHVMVAAEPRGRQASYVFVQADAARVANVGGQPVVDRPVARQSRASFTPLAAQLATISTLPVASAAAEATGERSTMAVSRPEMTVIASAAPQEGRRVESPSAGRDQSRPAEARVDAVQAQRATAEFSKASTPEAAVRAVSGEREPGPLGSPSGKTVGTLSVPAEEASVRTAAIESSQDVVYSPAGLVDVHAAEQVAAPIGARDAAYEGYRGQASLVAQMMGALVAPAALPEVGLVSSLDIAVAAPQAAILDFVERLAGSQAGLDARMLPIERPMTPDVFVPQPGQSEPAAPAAMMRSQRGAAMPELSASRQRVEAMAARSAGWHERPLDLTLVEPPRERSEAVTTPARSILRTAAMQPGAQAMAQAAEVEQPRAGTLHRPGGLGGLAEQMAGRIGVRAAGISIDFVEPEQAWAHARAAGMLSYVALAEPAEARTSPAETARVMRRAEAASSLASETTTAVQSSAASATAASDVTRAEQLDAVWSLIRVFPAAAQAAIMSLGDVERRVAGFTAAEETTARRVEAEEAREAGGEAVFSQGRRFDVIPNRRAELASGVSSTLVAPAMPTRPILPDGHIARGSFTWTKAAEFAQQFGEWMPPATVTAANESGEAAALGQPAWGAMEPIAVPSVREAFGETVKRPSLSLVSPSLSPTSSAATAARVGELTLPQLSVTSSTLRTLIQGQPVSSPGASERWVPPAQMALVQPPPVAAAPTSEATTKILDALRSQRTQERAPSDDRITLADLTLVAAASSTQQLAAAAQPAGESVGKSAAESSKAIVGAAKEEKSPEQEQREIEHLARRVVNELSTLLEISRERSGNTWEK